MKNRKGFTLAEMVAVIAILMVLALVSVPFVKSYIDDAYYGKAQLYLRQLHEARLNFEKDYPGLIIEGNLTKLNDHADCNIDSLYDNEDNKPLAPAELVRCHYVKFPTDLEQRYTFSIQRNGDIMAAMVGIDTSSKYYEKQVTINKLGQLSNENEMP